MRLEGKVAIVTGAGRGIGRAIAVGLAREGCAVVVNYSRSAAGAQEAVAEIVAAGGRGVAARADVGDLAQHEALIRTALTHYGGLDILVNNAGIEFREPFLEAKPETWDATFRVNLRGAYFLSQQAAIQMTCRGGGRILNISSVHDHSPHRNNSIYTITKGGMKMMTRGMALELAAHGITVNSLSPGAILTDINREVLADDAFREKVLATIPTRRIGDVTDVVGAAVFLVSSEARYVTGATLYVDGGMLLLS
jgi:glucose 1-dehydrogenase